MDKILNHPRSQRVADVSAMLFYNLSNGILGQGDYFSPDLSITMMNFVTDKFTKNLNSIEPFKKNVLVRDDVQKVFRYLLSFWEGNNKK